MFPKVCFGCAMPHISNVDEEVKSEDGTKSFHQNCYTEEEKGVVREFVVNIKEETK